MMDTIGMIVPVVVVGALFSISVLQNEHQTSFTENMTVSALRSIQLPLLRIRTTTTPLHQNFAHHEQQKTMKKKKKPSSDCTCTYTSNSILDRSGGIVYRTNILLLQQTQSQQHRMEWDVIYKEVMTIVDGKHLLRPEASTSMAHNRLGIALSSVQSSPTVKLLQDPNSSISKYVNRIAAVKAASQQQQQQQQQQYILSPDIPVEIRSYERQHAHMNWHKDDVLYTPIPQIEIILTILNTSNCRTMWELPVLQPPPKPHTNANDNTTVTKEVRQYSMETEPNSILCLRAGVVSHCVTPLKYGKRIIVKCAYTLSTNTTTYIPITASAGTTKSQTKPQFQSMKQQQQRGGKR
jgi:hypothetical protein